MAAIVTGLIPILRTAVDSTTTYKGRTIWFGILCVRLVSLFVAQLPWHKLDMDFSCNTTENVCIKSCFNKHFDKPVVMAWNFIFILLVLSVILMELFTAHVRTVLQKKLLREKKAVEVESLGELKQAPALAAETLILDMHGFKTAVLAYLFSMMLRVAVEGWFVYVLLFWNLPKLSDESIDCIAADHGCPKLRCLVRATAEKSMSIYALVSISSTVTIISCLFCLYFIGHYICNCCTKHSSSV